MGDDETTTGENDAAFLWLQAAVQDLLRSRSGDDEPPAWPPRRDAPSKNR